MSQDLFLNSSKSKIFEKSKILQQNHQEGSSRQQASKVVKKI